MPSSGRSRRSMVILHCSALIRTRSLSSIKISASCLRQKPELQKTFSRGALLNERPVSGGEACPALTMECGFCAASSFSRRLQVRLPAQLRHPHRDP